MDDPHRMTDRDHYERPHARWVCGNLNAGCPCQPGPDARGRCQATSECVPVLRDDQWLCTRSTVAGGPCQAGPLPDGTCCRSVAPCVPVRTVRGRRRIFVTTCTVLTLGILMLGISGPRREAFLNAGKLSSHHARLADGQGCETCHAAAHQGAGSWLQRMLNLGGDTSKVGDIQSDKCLACHAELFDDPWQQTAHNVNPEKLAARTASFSGRDFRFRELFGGSVHQQTSLACAMCHREHHGRDHDLEAMTNRQCQSCHAESFASLATGHPDFGDWPYRRRTRIAFNHLAHETKHFPQEAQAFDCARCHVDDATQTVKQLAGFDQACSSCHNASIQESFAAGIPLLTLPAIDRTLLGELDRDLPDWPESVSGFFDGTIPPLMQLLLSSDEQAVAAMERLGPPIDFSLIDETDPQQLHAAADLAEAIHRLMSALQADGNAEVQRRISVVFQREVREEEISVLTRRTPPVLLAAVAQAWFPTSSDDDLTSYLRRRVPTTSVSLRQPSQDQPTRRPRQVPQSSSPLPARRASFGRQDDSEWLAENPLRAWLEAELKAEQQAQVPSDPIEPTPPVVDTEQTPPAPTQNVNPAPPPQVEVVTREVVKLLPSGDWAYDDVTMKLSYAPSGHADALLKELLDLVGTAPEAARTPVVQRVVAQLVEDAAPGRCASCHTIDGAAEATVDAALESASLQAWYVNWQGKTRVAGERSFTRFVHRPHLIQSETQDCAVCHALDRGYVFDETQRDLNPHVFRSEFLPLRKGTCASCHQPQGASDRCTTCHNYHVQSHSAGSKW